MTLKWHLARKHVIRPSVGYPSVRTPFVRTYPPFILTQLKPVKIIVPFINEREFNLFTPYMPENEHEYVSISYHYMYASKKDSVLYHDGFLIPTAI